MTDATPVDFAVLPDPVRWVVIHTRPRCEKKMASAARRAGIHAYLPLRSREHRYGNRRRVFSAPLFSGYLFCRGDLQQRRWLRQNQHTANVLEVVGQEDLARQLAQIHAALESGLIVEVMPFLETGRRVRVTAGPLRGFEGVVLRVQGRERVLLTVDMIRQAAVVEIDSALLKPI
jgi:transcription antitermination factor NusG